jgi:dihydrofolate synthase/folylpolyglutamate synthase
MIASLTEALDALFDFAGVNDATHSPLSAMSQALALLADPHRRLRVIHVTGTSGKTSTSYAIRALLEAAGRSTGLTVSPHITSINERVQIGGRPIDPVEFCERTDRLLHSLVPLRGQLTYFELVLCLAFTAFAERDVDYAVVEVGIGGTNDATNVARRSDKIGVIGPIGLDHTERLGSTLAKIAAHKAGIMTPAGVAFLARQSGEAMAVVEAEAARIGAELHVVEPGQEDDSVFPSRWPLFQRANWAMALAVVRHLARRDGFDPPSADQVRHMVATGWVEPFQVSERRVAITPPARYEWLTVPGHRVLLDGAHNPQKAASLVQAARSEGCAPMPTLATLSQAPIEKLRATLAQLAPLMSHLIVPEFTLGRDGKVKRSMPAQAVLAVARQCGIQAEPALSLHAGLDTLLARTEADLLVTGSLYLAATVRPWLLDRRDRSQRL